MATRTSAPRPKELRQVVRSTGMHWVGNGFPVRTLFVYSDLGALVTPFLLLDYAGPAEFAPSAERRGVGEHPHRGFETVTIVYAGEVEHRDSSGGGGTIGPGDVQWMTAASGVVHAEFHGPAFAARGGPFEMVQLWVNLPAKDKMAPPRYQSLSKAEIPTVRLGDGKTTARVIAGALAGQRGPAQTFTPIHVLDLHLAGAETIEIPVPDGFTTLLVVLRGTVAAADSRRVGAAEVGIFDRAGDAVRFTAEGDATALLLCGQPIEEPIVGRGPFVMNTAGEIRQAMEDYASGRMGSLE